jgi:hypothetical protein
MRQQLEQQQVIQPHPLIEDPSFRGERKNKYTTVFSILAG